MSLLRLADERAGADSGAGTEAVSPPRGSAAHIAVIRKYELQLAPDSFDKKQLTGLSLSPQLRDITICARGCDKTDQSFDSRCLQLVAKTLPTELRRLELNFAGCTGIDDVGLRHLARRLPPCLCRLTLDVSGLPNTYAPMRISDQGLLAIARVMPSFKCLDRFDLRVESCPRIGNDGVHAVSGGLPETLTRLRLTFNNCSNIGDAGLIGLASSMPKGLTDLELNFFGCHKIEDGGLACLTEAFPHELHRLRLDFRATRITEKSLGQVARALPPDLEELELDTRLCDIEPMVREMTDSLHTMRDWQRALLAQDDALQKPGDDRAAYALASFVKHDHFFIRRLAAKTLGMLGDAALPHLPLIIDLLVDQVCDVWLIAAESIVRLGSTTSSPFLRDACLVVAPHVKIHKQYSPHDDVDVERASMLPEKGELAELLMSRTETLASHLNKPRGDERTRRAAAEALGKLGAVAAPHAAALAVCLEDQDDRVREAAAEALGQVGNTATPFAPAVAQLLSDEDEDVRFIAAKALGRFGPAVAGAYTSDLAAQLSMDETREAALQLLGAIGPASSPHAALIAKCLADRDWRVRRAAAEALGQLGHAASPFAFELAQLLHDGAISPGPIHVDLGHSVRDAAARALVKLPSGAVDPHTLAYISLAAQANQGIEVKKRADDALWDLGDAKHAAALVAVLDDDDWKIRVAAAEAIGRLGTAACDFATALVGCLNDKEVQVREAAATALRILPLPDAALAPEGWAFAAVAPHGDRALQWRAREALTGLGDRTHAAALATLFGKDSSVIQRGALEALGELGAACAPHAVEIAKLMGVEEGNAVRAAAQTALQLLLNTVGQMPKHVVPPAPSMDGHLWKKSPSLLRMGTYQWRFVRVFNGKIAWWPSREQQQDEANATVESGDGDDDVAGCNGFVNLQAAPCEAISTAKNREEKESSKVLLRPYDGQWTHGSCSGGIPDREFRFDAEGSEYCAAAWIYIIRLHMVPCSASNP